MQIHIQHKAREDLKNIWLYSYGQWGEAQADKYFDELSDGINGLLDNPRIGRACDHIRTGYRKYPINKHVVFYRITSDRIEIIRVLHSSMDAEGIF
jgi:toxin ParE1/3/4